MIVKVFDVGNKIKSNEINDVQRKNINKIFSSIVKEKQLIISCYLDLELPTHKESPLYYMFADENNTSSNFERVAQDLLIAEMKADGTRNDTIKEGLLFIKKDENSLIILKLEKLSVIDRETYEYKLELGSERNYFKACIFDGDYSGVKIIDKNKTASKYWYEKFLKLSKLRTDEDNTKDLIELLQKDKLFSEEINSLPKYKDIKSFAKQYLIENVNFDKSGLMHRLNIKDLIHRNVEEQVFSQEALEIDSDFKICKKIVNKAYRVDIKVNEYITIRTKDYVIENRRGNIHFDEKNKVIRLFVNDDYLDEVREKFENAE